jgi:HTH-type transcriptional regulator/antitoxin HigA
VTKVQQAQSEYSFDPDYVTEPGDILLETTAALGITQKELAARTGFTAKHINQLIRGVKRISPETALRLEKVTSVPARFWNNLETKYQERKARIADQQATSKDLAWLKLIPTGELIRRNAIRTTSDQSELIQETLTFFRVASVKAWCQGWTTSRISFRKSADADACSGKIAAWVRLAEMDAESVDSKPFDAKRFQSALHDLRKLAAAGPDVFVPAMRHKCSEAGVALALVQEIPGGKVSGAAKWLNPRKAMIALNLRGKALDKFWFTFFHEAGHILNDSHDEVFIDVDYVDDPREKSANDFARDLLIPPGYADRLRTLRSDADVVEFSRLIQVHPCIVVGRLQRERIWPYNRKTTLKARMDWAE